MSKNFGQFTQGGSISDTDKIVGHSGTSAGGERGWLWSLVKSTLKTYFDTLYAAATHTHAQSDITNLTTDLAGKASSSHTHAQSDITNLTTDLAGKANSSHSHAISDVTGLQTALDGKASSSHTHSLSAITDAGTAASHNVPATGDAASGEVVKGNDSRLSDARTPTTHSHAISDVTGLQTALDGKASSSHSHAISDVTGLQTALDGKAASSHTHPQSDITNLTNDLAARAGRWTGAFDGQGSVIASGVSVFKQVFLTGTITKAALVGDAAGAITLTVKRYTPSGGALGSATTLGTIALASTQHDLDTVSWSVTAGDVLEILTGGTISTVTRVNYDLSF